MNKVAVVGDIHLGIKSSDRIKKNRILKSQSDFFDFLDKKLTELGISEILWAGDIFDVQNSIETPIIEFAVNLFTVRFGKYKHHIIVGNHDIFLRDSLDVSSLACLEKLSNVTVYRSLTKVNIIGLNILMTPYLVSDISKKFTSNLDKIGQKCDVVFGHFDIIGAKMENGEASNYGLEMKPVLENIKLTISGHYHNISSYKLGNNVIQYVGTPYQLTFGDVGQTRGFWTLNEKCEMEFFENTVSAVFKKIDISDIDIVGDVSNSFIKCTYPNNISDEDLFKMNKIIEDKTPISYVTEPRPIEKLEDIEMDDEESNETFSEMCDYLNDGDFISVCDVYMGIEPPKNVKLVKELLLEIKSKVKNV